MRWTDRTELYSNGVLEGITFHGQLSTYVTFQGIFLAVNLFNFTNGFHFSENGDSFYPLCSVFHERYLP
jgi:hypothetical protein